MNEHHRDHKHNWNNLLISIKSIVHTISYNIILYYIILYITLYYLILSYLILYYKHITCTFNKNPTKHPSPWQVAFSTSRKFSPTARIRSCAVLGAGAAVFAVSAWGTQRRPVSEPRAGMLSRRAPVYFTAERANLRSFQWEGRKSGDLWWLDWKTCFNMFLMTVWCFFWAVGGLWFLDLGWFLGSAILAVPETCDVFEAFRTQ